MSGYRDKVYPLKSWTVKLEYDESLDLCIREVDPMLNTLRVDIHGEISPNELSRLIVLLQEISRQVK